MNSEDKKYLLQQVSDWVRFSDSKAGILLSLQGAILTIIFTLTTVPKIGLSTSFILFVLGIIIFCVSVVVGINAVIPILEVGAPSSKIFFGHIAKSKNPTDYINMIENPLYDFEKDLLTQVWANSVVAWRKYELIRVAILWGIIGFALIASSYVLK